MEIDTLVRPQLIGPALAREVNDDRWSTLEAELITGGKSNLTFRLRSSAGEMILRRPPTGQLLPRAHDMGREVRVQRALRGSAIPVADIVLFEEQAGLLDVPFYVMERLPGAVLTDTVDPACSPETLGLIADGLIDTLAALHGVDVGAAGLAGFGRPDNHAARQVRTWWRQYETAQTRDIPAVTELHDRLAGHQWQDPGVPSVVHGDYRLDNCLVDFGPPPTICGVLDWELSTLGDPLCDLGMLLLYWVQPGEPEPLLTPSLTAVAGFPTRAQVAERYARTSGRSLDDLDAYVALAHFKFVGIAQGMSSRVAGGQMAGQDFGDIDAEIDRIAAAGLDALKGIA